MVCGLYIVQGCPEGAVRGFSAHTQRDAKPHPGHHGSVVSKGAHVNLLSFLNVVSLSACTQLTLGEIKNDNDKR